jgi:hypothetical protein
MLNNTTGILPAGLTISLLIQTILFIPVFYSDYAYLDEAYQLWHNKDRSNYNTIFVQARWLSGILFDKFYSAIPDISGLKIIRIFSFFSWALFLEQFFRLGKRWQQLTVVNDRLLFISGVYIACSLSVTIYIGWAGCFEAGIASLTGLWSGSLLFEQLVKKKEWKAVSIFSMAVIVLLGLCSLFMYQIAFGAFLIPFAFYLISRKSFANGKIMLTGAGAYLGIIMLYYLVFILSLKLSAVTPSDRTTISTNVADKLGFFFGIPLSQAFSFNFLYNLHSIVSQAFPFLMMLFWITSYFKMAKDKTANKMIFIGSFIGLCMLIYIPVLVSKENFASYRTMFVFNFAASVLLIDAGLSLAGSAKAKTILSIVLISFFACVGFRNFRYNFIGPLQQEYKLLKNSFDESYRPGIDTIYFLRPPENIFYGRYGIRSYKDEFGVPSSFKDWTPEPLMKQLIMEKTKNRSIAEKAVIIQFTDRAAFEAAAGNKTAASLIIDPESLFK